MQFWNPKKNTWAHAHAPLIPDRHHTKALSHTPITSHGGVGALSLTSNSQSGLTAAAGAGSRGLLLATIPQFNSLDPYKGHGLVSALHVSMTIQLLMTLCVW